MKTALTVLGPLFGLLLGAVLQQASAGRNWWREKRADAYAGVVRAVEDLRHRFDEVTEPHHHGGPPLQSDQLIGMAREWSAAKAIALLYGGPGVRKALDEYQRVVWRQVDACPEDIDYVGVTEEGNAVISAMHAELRGRRLKWLN